MSPTAALLIFEFASLVFAFSIHECAHAWTAWRLGDPTAKMLGRVTLNPIRHLDPLGSLILPILAAVYHLPLIGWAKPVPITTRNLKHLKRDDVLISMAGPISNLLVAVVCLGLLLGVKHLLPGGGMAVGNVVALALGAPDTQLGGGVAFPLTLLLFTSVLINLSLAVFNVIPVPPLDGSRVLRHFLPYSWLNAYDQIGRFSLLILMLFGGRLLGVMYYPVLAKFVNALFTL